MNLYKDDKEMLYRKDLIEKYKKNVKKKWDEMDEKEKEIMEKESEEGKDDIWGFVFKGNEYEGMKWNEMEWIKY